MRTLLLHLSDLHIKTEEDAILNRVGAIVDAVQNLDYDMERALVITTGDIAFAGSDDQYVLALEFFESLRSALLSQLRVKPSAISMVFLPGNHDCLLAGHQGGRDAMLKAARENSDLLKDKKALDLILNVQANYGYFSAKMTEGCTQELLPGVDPRLCHAQLLVIGAYRIRIICCNSAWLSQNPERQGSLYLSPELLPQFPGKADLTITCMHHPYNWFDAISANQLRARLESFSDFILTGHEHDAQRRVVESLESASTTYFEGGALQEHGDADDNRFSAIVVDLAEQRYRQWMFTWDDVAFTQCYPGSCEAEEWREYPGKLLQDRNDLQFTEDFLKYLSDPGLPLEHREKGNLSLLSIYVFPELDQVVYNQKDPKERISAKLLIEKLLQCGSLLITGDDQIGKSALAKILVLASKESGLTPVLVRAGKNKLPTGERLYDRLNEYAEEAYGKDSRETFRRTARERRVLIVDDFDHMPIAGAERAALLENLHNYADHVVVIANQRSFSVEEIIHPIGWSHFTQYRIKEFNHALRYKLCEKWLYSEAMNGDQAKTFVRRMAEVSKDIATVTGKHYVPAYPPYLLAILQASESARQVDTAASTHGYFYEMLINLHLAKGENKANYDTLVGYLTHLSWSMFLANKDRLTSAELLAIHREYQERFARNVAFKDMRDALLGKRILVWAEDEVIRFKYPYYLYYFVALHLKDKLGSGEIRDVISKVANDINVERNSNVLMFLAHLSKDPFVVETFISRANTILPNAPVATLETELQEFKYQQLSEEPHKPLADLPPEEASRLNAEALDNTASTVTAEADGDEETKKLLGDLNVGLQMVRILGQLLKNFPGTLEAEPKFAIAEACYLLGLRMLGVVLRLIRSNSRILYDGFLENIQRRRPGGSHEEAVVRARESVMGLALLNSLGAVRLVATSAGAPDTNSTYERVLDKHRSTAVQLIDFAIKVDQSAFPEELNETLLKGFSENYPAAWVLKQVVLIHFEAGLEEDWRLKQRVCGLYGISYKQVRQISALEVQPRAAEKRLPPPKPKEVPGREQLDR